MIIQEMLSGEKKEMGRASSPHLYMKATGKDPGLAVHRLSYPISRL
jgi:hypothetical protein